MEKAKLTFEKLPDGTCVITVKGKNMHNDTFIRQEIIKETAVFEALKEVCEGESSDENSGLHKHDITNSEAAVVKCPECLQPCTQEELDMFGGLCEECTTDW